jgi:hypothetical protein
MFLALLTLCGFAMLAGYVMGKKGSEIKIKTLEDENSELNRLLDLYKDQNQNQ